MADRVVGRLVGNLLLALLNATLILAALCLWFAWSALSTAERVSGQISAAAETVLPMRAEIAGLTEEIAAARADLAARDTTGGANMSALEARIAGVEAQLAELTAAVSTLAADPEALIDRAVTSAFDGLGETVAKAIAGLRGTSPAQ
ncbi:MAG TPA: hypothetical protein VJ906_11440 [Roseovarius sp.]|nr:hypothetical protein [Roseovarius sp.]